MASALHKRLQRLEELLSEQINSPLATIWLNEGDDPEAIRDKLVADGKVTAADRSRIRFFRWLTPEEAFVQEPQPWEQPQAGPPGIAAHREDPGAGVPTLPHAVHTSVDVICLPYESPDAYRARLKHEEQRILNEKLADAYAKRSFV